MYKFRCLLTKVFIFINSSIITQSNQAKKVLQERNSQNHQLEQVVLQQEQQQIMTEKDKQVLQQIQYYVLEDLTNFLEILIDVTVSYDYFKNEPNHEYIAIAKNRLITQTNISNCIHFDCVNRYSNTKEEQLYIKEIENAEEIFNHIMDEVKISIPECPKIHECLDLYKTNFFKKAIFYISVSRNGDFNMDVVQKVFSGMQHVENKQSQIQKGSYQKLGEQQIKENLKSRKKRAYKLLENFKLKLNQIQEKCFK